MIYTTKSGQVKFCRDKLIWSYSSGLVSGIVLVNTLEVFVCNAHLTFLYNIDIKGF